ncbi:hypothetical protein MASR2M15_04560 [Anaerolineales bacterium]
MENKDLLKRIEELEAEVKTLTRLAEISTSLNSIHRLQPLLDLIMEVAVDVTDCEAASVMLWNRFTRELFFTASTSKGTVSNLLGKPVPLDSIAGTIYTENRVVIVEDVNSDERHYKEVDKDIAFETRSILGVPLSYTGNVIGVLEVLNKNNPPWTEADIHSIKILSSQAAVAIEVAKLVTDLRKANEELSELDKLKNDFIAVASHELRTPLGVILGYASFLEEDGNEETKELAAKVTDSALRLRKVIESLINLRYVKQGADELKKEETDVNRLLRLVELDLMPLRLPQRVDVQPGTETILILADKGRMMMAFSNLMNNAIRFTPEEGEVKLTVEKRNTREVWIRIQDTGIGIPKEELENIFKEFYQVEDHMVRHYEGLGIGLSIARAIINTHDGRLWAESDGPGQGATFIIALPIHMVT